MHHIPKNFEEFNLVMEQIDSMLREKNVPIHARSFQAVGEYAKLFKIEIRAFPRPPRGNPTVFTGSDVASHIENWFEHRYGNRQKIFMGPGSTVIVLRGDPWEMRVPRVYGTVRCVVERDLALYANTPKLSTSGAPPILNLLELIVDLPPRLAAQLTDDECRTILSRFQHALDCMHAVEYMLNDKYQFVEEAFSDIHAGIRHIFSLPSHFGQSKWSSAQAAEKLLKAYLKAKEIVFPFSHDIHHLAELAQSDGMRPVEAQCIDVLQTRATVRYGEEKVSLEQAAAAHYAALAVGRRVSETLIPS